MCSRHDVIRMCGRDVARVCGRDVFRVRGRDVFRVCGRDVFRVCGRDVFRVCDRDVFGCATARGSLVSLRKDLRVNAARKDSMDSILSLRKKRPVRRRVRTLDSATAIGP